MRRFVAFETLVAPLLVVVGLSVVHGRWWAEEPYDFFATSRVGWAVAYAAVIAVAGYALGLPDSPVGGRRGVVAAVAAAGGAALVVSVAQLVVGDALLPRFVVFGSALGLLPVFGLAASAASNLTGRRRELDRVVVVGDVADASALWHDLGAAVERPAELLGILSPAEAQATRHSAPLVESVASLGATIVVLDSAAQLDRSVVRQAAALHERGVRIRTLLGFYESWLGKLPLSELERLSLLFDIGEIHRARYSRAKRVLDVAGGAVLGLAFVVAMPLVAIGNLIGNRGPLFYRQERVGKGGEPFEILKFRSMVDSGSAIGEWTDRSDPRVTAFGRILRVTHLDELPQAWNILRGELSVVGPRPEQRHYVEELASKLPFYGMRHLVRPGLTGWAQVKYGYASDHGDALEKLQYEFYYLRHQSLSFDVKIIVRTLRTIASGNGR